MTHLEPFALQLAAIAAEVILPLYRADHGLADKGAISGKAFDPVTEADRGAPSSIDSSPTMAPAPRMARMRSLPVAVTTPTLSKPSSSR